MGVEKTHPFMGKIFSNHTFWKYISYTNFMAIFIFRILETNPQTRNAGNVQG